eukprot:snap_masked-scaffold_11-processed-gene-1.12-mRNA-1 protein AED:1.00 eAED:1.00 QI:0/0/0/0/1/1/2/0/82
MQYCVLYYYYIQECFPRTLKSRRKNIDFPFLLQLKTNVMNFPCVYLTQKTWLIPAFRLQNQVKQEQEIKIGLKEMSLVASKD